MINRNAKIYFMVALGSTVLAGCSTATHMRSQKTIIVHEDINRPLILAKASQGTYQKIGELDEYELYQPVEAERRNYLGNKHDYIAVESAGEEGSKVCLPDSMNFMHCSKIATTIIKNETK